MAVKSGVCGVMHRDRPEQRNANHEPGGRCNASDDSLKDRALPPLGRDPQDPQNNRMLHFTAFGLGK